MFLPVDMPLLPGALMGELASTWADDTHRGMHIAFAVYEGVPQPLVSLMRRRALPVVADAVRRMEFKVRPILERAAEELAVDAHTAVELALCRTSVSFVGEGDLPGTVWVGKQRIWSPSAAEWRCRHLWFGNLNTPEEFGKAQTYVGGVI